MTLSDVMIVLLIWIPLIMLSVFALVDLTRRSDLTGLAKGLWAIAIVLLPLLGMFVYFITRPDDADVQTKKPTTYEETTRVVMIDEETLETLQRLGNLRDTGVITDGEFNAIKQQMLGGTNVP